MGSNRSDRTQENLEKRCKWAAQQALQALIRPVLKASIYEVYHLATGENFTASRGNSLTQVTADKAKTAEQAAAAAYLQKQNAAG